MFEYYVGIDWSGAATDGERIDGLAVAAWTPGGDPPRIVDPGRRFPRWSRTRLETWLITMSTAPSPRSLVVADFGFGLPWNADRAVFGATGWRAMLAAISSGIEMHGTARAFAAHINHGFPEGGPFRFDDDRTDFRFYLRHNVAYYRLTDLCAPQALSHWYLGAGATVGCSTLTGMAMLHRVLRTRDQSGLPFAVWPHEGASVGTASHVLVEGYPAILPRTANAAAGHDADALRMVAALKAAHETGRAGDLLRPPAPAFGRYHGVDVAAQQQFEGWIVGLS